MQTYASTTTNNNDDINENQKTIYSTGAETIDSDGMLSPETLNTVESTTVASKRVQIISSRRESSNESPPIRQLSRQFSSGAASSTASRLHGIKVRHFIIGFFYL